MTKLQAIREFCAFVCNDKITVARDKFSYNNWAMDIANTNPRIKTPKEFVAKPDASDKIFRKNFVERCPLANGFAHITLTLLHECGHWATRSAFDAIEYDKAVQKAYCQTMYMDIPWERLATEWAICWLQSPINRKIAKQFERKYFGKE